MEIIALYGLCAQWTMISRAENNGQQVTGHNDQPNIFLAQTNLDSGQLNNECYNIFLPKEYQIMLAIDHFYYIDVQVFGIKLMKNAFTSCRVPFCSFCAF